MRKEYNPKNWWNRWYKKTSEFSDRITISRGCKKIVAKYHYNVVENSIIEVFHKNKVSSGNMFSEIPNHLSIWDIGSGAGHWIDFYINLFNVDYCRGTDISKSCVKKLLNKYIDDGKVEICCEDVSESGMELNKNFHIINAIGVMFHIVNDSKWHEAMLNFSNHLNADGKIIIGGSFGPQTKVVSKKKFIRKKVRSFDDWSRCADSVGLKIIDLKKARKKESLKTPANNLLILGKA